MFIMKSAEKGLKAAATRSGNAKSPPASPAKKKAENKSSEPSGDERAFIYQQAMELTPLLSQGHSHKEPIAVVLKKNPEKSTYSVTFILIPHSLNLHIQCEGKNLFDVCINAKNKARRTILQLLNQSSTHPIRNLKLKHFKKFPYIQ